MNKFLPIEPIQYSLRNSLPDIEPNVDNSDQVPFTYVPPSHARAIEPDSVLVEGIRGAGKSFWWSALNQEAYRRFVATAFPETGLNLNTQTGPGFGTKSANDKYPAKDVIQNLAKKSDPRNIWKAVIAQHMKFEHSFPLNGKWGEKVAWVENNPEDFESNLLSADRNLSSKKTSYIFLFDALDRLASDWQQLRPIARSLFQVALDISSCRSIRFKMFVRPDMIEDRDIMKFQDSSKLIGKKVSLSWRKVDLYALAFQCIGNDPKHGKVFRDFTDAGFRLAWKRDSADTAWMLPQLLRIDEELQKKVFHTITGPHMASGPSGHKRGFPYTWLPNHLADGREQVSPRSFNAALRAAATFDHSIPSSWKYPLHFRGLYYGVQRASEIRVTEVTEDYPWVYDLMQPLRQLVVPCAFSEFLVRWKKEKTSEKIAGKESQNELPPKNLSEGPNGLLDELKSLGIIQKMNDDRIQMPDVYRIAFGLGRKGGVKPVK